MDLHIAKELSQLQADKLAIETGTDLSKHCDTLVELDARVGSLLDEVKTLKADLEQRFGFMEEKYNQLGPSYETLLISDQTLDLVIGLNRLNKICRRLETNPNIVHSAGGRTMHIRFLVRVDNADENIDLEAENKSTLLTVTELLETFESAYKPLEEAMSKRQDLPYADIATKVRDLRSAISKLQPSNEH